MFTCVWLPLVNLSLLIFFVLVPVSMLYSPVPVAPMCSSSPGLLWITSDLVWFVSVIPLSLLGLLVVVAVESVFGCFFEPPTQQCV